MKQKTSFKQEKVEEQGSARKFFLRAFGKKPLQEASKIAQRFLDAANESLGENAKLTCKRKILGEGFSIKVDYGGCKYALAGIMVEISHRGSNSTVRLFSGRPDGEKFYFSPTVMRSVGEEDICKMEGMLKSEVSYHNRNLAEYLKFSQAAALTYGKEWPIGKASGTIPSIAAETPQ